MAITTVKGPSAPATNFEIICSDKACNAVLRFTSEDVGWNNTYSMGRIAGTYQGIVCPHCNQVLRLGNAQVID